LAIRASQTVTPASKPRLRALAKRNSLAGSAAHSGIVAERQPNAVEARFAGEPEWDRWRGNSASNKLAPAAS
jgi:hypothetical protein